MPPMSTHTASATTSKAILAAAVDAQLQTRATRSTAFSDPFITGIQIVQTIALGILLVLACLTLFYCHQQYKAASMAKATCEKFDAISDKLANLKGQMFELQYALEGNGGGSMADSSQCEVNDYKKRKRESGASAWEREMLFGAWEKEVLRRLKLVQMGESGL